MCVTTPLWGNVTPPLPVFDLIQLVPTCANSLPVSWVCSQPTAQLLPEPLGLQIKSRSSGFLIKSTEMALNQRERSRGISPAIPVRLTASL